MIICILTFSHYPSRHPSALGQKETPQPRLRSIVLALPIFTGSEPTAAGGGRKEASEWQGSVGDAGVCAKDSRRDTPTGQPQENYHKRRNRRAPQTETGEILILTSKNLHPNGWRLNMFALPIFTASHPATIVGVRVLNFCVRDGNRWTHTTINTNYLDGFNHHIYVKEQSSLTA